MSELLEIFMVVSFGASWPLNVIKSYKARTTKGKSLWFLILIFALIAIYIHVVEKHLCLMYKEIVR